jgi:ribosomal protein L37AE/L43A
MPITILDYVKSKAGEKDSYSGEDFLSHGVEMLGGCEICQATIAAYNAYPSKSGFWRCADCIGDSGFITIDEFARDQMDLGAVLAQDEAETGEEDPGEQWVTCPSCGGLDSVVEIVAGRFQCDECDAEWTL